MRYQQFRVSDYNEKVVEKTKKLESVIQIITTIKVSRENGAYLEMISNEIMNF